MQPLSKRPRGGFLAILFNSGWLTIARVSGDLAGVVLFIGISRNLGLEAIGQYSFAFAVSTFVWAFVSAGLEEFGLREYSRLDVAARRVMFREIIGLQVNLLFIVVAVVAAILAFTATPPDTTLVVVLVAIHVVTFQFSLMLFIPSFSDQQLLAPAIGEFVCRVGAMCICTWLVTAGNSSLAVAMVPLAAGTTLLLGFAVWSARRHNGELRLVLDWRRMAARVAEVWPFAASTIIYVVYGRAAVVILAAFRGEAETGIYGTAFKLYEFGLMPLYLLGVAVFPALSRSFAIDDSEFGKTADKFLRVALVVGAVLAWGLIFVAPAVLATVLGDEFAAASPATRLMAIVAFLTAVDVVALRLMLAMHLQAARVKIHAVAAAVNIAVNLALIPKYGVNGAIAATVIAQVIMIVWYFVYFGRYEAARRLIGTLRIFALILGVVTVATVALRWMAVSEVIAATVALGLLLSLVAATKFVPSPRQLLRSHSA